MAFGQAAGPPASARKIDELADLLERAGFASFREARHPYGLTQRQAAGKFTTDEADELIERLTAAETVQLAGGAEAEVATAAAAATAATDPAPLLRPPRTERPRSAAALEAERRREERRTQLLDSFPDAPLVAELERRGWCCIPPITDET